jgi:peroxin-6
MGTVWDSVLFILVKYDMQLLICRCLSRILTRRIVKAVLFGNPSFDKSCSEHTDQVVSASPSGHAMGFLPCRTLLLVLHPWMKMLVMLAHFWHSTWDCMFLALNFLFKEKGSLSRAEEIDATASSGSDLSLHLDLLPCPQVPKYALHL